MTTLCRCSRAAAITLIVVVLATACRADATMPQEKQASNQQPKQSTSEDQDMPSSAAAAFFIRRFAQLTERLASNDIVVSRLLCDWGGFGSWEIEVQSGEAADRYGAALLKGDFDTPGPDVIRMNWDGRDRVLTVSSSPTEPLSAPNDWKVDLEKTFPEDSDPLVFLESHLAKRLPQAKR